MVGVAADEDHIVELPIEGEFVCVESKPCVYSFLNHSARRVRAKVLVVEDDVVLYQCVLELTLLEKKVSVFCVSSAETAPVIVCFSNVKKLSVDSEMCRNQFRDVLEKAFYIDLAHVLPCKSFVYLCEISAIDEYSYRKVVCVCHMIMFCGYSANVISSNR